MIFWYFAVNVINSTVGINLNDLRHYEKQLRLLCRKSTSIQKSIIWFWLWIPMKLFSKLFGKWFLLWILKKFSLYRKVSTHNKTIQHYKFSKNQKLNKNQYLRLCSKEKRSTKPLQWSKGKIASENKLKSLDKQTATQKQKTKESLRKNGASDVIDFNETGELTANTNSTKVSLSQILYNLQQPNKKIPRIPLFFERITVKPRFGTKEKRQKKLNPTLETTRKGKDHSPKFWRASDEESEEHTKGKASGSKMWTTLWEGPKTIGETVHTSSRRLRKYSKLNESK